MKPRVLMISGDISALDPVSALSRRLSQYIQLCEELSVLVFSRTTTGNRREGNLSIQSISLTPSFFSLYRAIMMGEKMEKPDIVTTQDPFFLGLIGLCISRHHRVPLQIQIHTDLFSREFLRFSIGNRVRSYIAQVLIPHAGGVRVVSEKIKKDLIERKLIEPSRITVSPIPFATTFTLQEHQEKTGLHIVTVSRLTPEKDISLALHAFTLVHTQRPDATFTIVGDGPLRQSLEDEARRLGISDFVFFEGNKADVTPYYKDATVYLSCSHYEGYGLSLVEAASYGLPLVSTDVGIARELSPSTIVSWDAQKIADMLLLPKLPLPHIPQPHSVDTEAYSHSIVEDWKKISQLPYYERKGKKVWFVIKYVISGGSATAVNLSFLYIFTDFFDIWYVYSAALAYAAAFVVSFTLQKFWTFKNGTLSHIKYQFVLYVALGTFNMFLNSYLIYFVVESTGFHYLAAQLCVGVFLALWSLMFYRILFKNK